METSIEWTASLIDGKLHPGFSFNTHWGCTEQGAECDNCYARVMAERWGWTIWGNDAPRRFQSDKYWENPIKWNHQAEKLGGRLKVFANSMSDLFEGRDDLDEVRLRLWNVIELTPNLDWLLLTKLPHNIKKMIPESWKENPPKNIWYGASVGVNKSKWRIKHLQELKGIVRFLSCEPLLEELTDINLDNIDWVIVGGESGRKKRPFTPYQARLIRDQCKEKGISFFMKQWDKIKPIPSDLQIREFPKSQQSLTPTT